MRGGFSNGPIESRYASSSLSVRRPSAAMIAATRLLASITASGCARRILAAERAELVGDAVMNSATSRSIGLGMGSQATPREQSADLDPGGCSKTAPGPDRRIVHFTAVR